MNRFFHRFFHFLERLVSDLFDYNTRMEDETDDRIKKTSNLTFYNCHVHIFNLDHVHKRFLKGLIPWWLRLVMVILTAGIICLIVLCWHDQLAISILLIVVVPISILLTLFVLISHNLNHLLKRSSVWLLKNTLFNIFPSKHFDVAERYANLILHSYYGLSGNIKKQKEIFDDLRSYYPKSTKFVVLSMDMDYMIDCRKPLKESTFSQQLYELRMLKENSHYSNKIYPFIHADPRRINDDPEFYKNLKDYLIRNDDKKNGIFQGIKIYPALGYFPFDRRLKPVYDLALEYNLPITTHCSVGPVFYRGKLRTLRKEGYYSDGVFRHPFTGNVLRGKRPGKFTPHFTHPLNYYCLMYKPDQLYEFWKECNKSIKYDLKILKDNSYTITELREYRKLKICLGHYGGSGEWIKYLRDPWLPKEIDLLKIGKDLIHDKKGQWKHEVDGEKIKKTPAPSWFSIITDMLSLKTSDRELAFPNLYADISYNLSNEDMLPLLKVMLETNPVLFKKILFGTDFYMVSTQGSEREITLKLRSYIGERNFRQIAELNPLDFIS